MVVIRLGFAYRVWPDAIASTKEGERLRKRYDSSFQVLDSAIGDLRQARALATTNQ